MAEAAAGGKWLDTLISTIMSPEVLVAAGTGALNYFGGTQKQEADRRQQELLRQQGQQDLQATQAFTSQENALNRANALQLAGMRGGGGGSGGTVAAAKIAAKQRATEAAANAVLQGGQLKQDALAKFLQGLRDAYGQQSQI